MVKLNKIIFERIEEQMRINLDWLIPTIFVGGVALFGYWQYPQAIRNDLKLILAALEIIIGLYGFFLLVDKIFSFTGLTGRGIATVVLVSPAIEIYERHRISKDNIVFGVILFTIYIAVRIFFQKKENEKRYQEQLIMRFINEHFDVNNIKIEENASYPYGKKVTDKNGVKAMVYYENDTVKQSKSY